MLVVLWPMSALSDVSRADSEAQIDDGLKEFGYLAGLGRGCVTGEQVGRLERAVVDLHANIGRLLGTDRAFLFGAAFGYGTSVLTPTEECAAILSRYEAQVESFFGSTGLRP